MPSEQQEAWLTAVRRPEVALGLEAVYACIAEAVQARGPACWASGRCCNFRRAGHLLYVTGLETAYAIDRLGGPPAAVDLDAALARGDCPYLAANLCGVHTVKPLGCRVYFCDESAQRWQEELSERGLSMIRRLHDEHGIDYRYGEWRAMLAGFVSGA
ncbi:MAG: hypothetical protein ACOYN0_08705 [Phycisphaerales bacterium]